jgi:hypothetical protein
MTYTRATFAGTNEKYTTGELLPYAPQIVGRADVAAQTDLGRIGDRTLAGRIGIGTQSLLRRPLPYGEFGHDVFLVSASAGVRLREVALGVDVFNLLDARWYDGEFVYPSRFDPHGQPSLLPARHVSVGAPRSVLVSLSVYL